MYRNNFRPSPMPRPAGGNGNRMGNDNGNWGRCDMPVKNDGCCKEKNNCACENDDINHNNNCGHDCKDEGKRDICECNPSVEDQLAGLPLVMSYIPWQDYRDVACEADGWANGTIFRQLDFDFQARRCN